MDRKLSDNKRMFGFKVGRRWVATCGDFERRLTVPGGADVPTAAVTVVTVHPPYRRRGLLTAMMKHQLEQVAKRGEPLAALWASEALIYGRYGYGPATTRAVLKGNEPAAELPAWCRDLGFGGRGHPRGVPRGGGRAARVHAPRAARDDGPRQERVGVRDLRRGARATRRLRDPLRPALRRRRRRGRVRDVPLQGEVRRGARGRGRDQGGVGRGPRGVRQRVALPARPRPRPHLQLGQRAPRRAPAPPGHRRPRSRHLGHRQPLRAHRRRAGRAGCPQVRRRRRPGHRGRRPDPHREHRPLPHRHRRRPRRIETRRSPG